MPDDDGARPTSGRAIAQHMEEETAVEKELSRLRLRDTVNRFLPEQQVHDFRHKPETEIKEEESLPSDDDNDAYQKGKTEIDAKAGATRHLSRYPDGMSERVTTATDAKVGQTQHSLMEHSLRHAKTKLVNDGNRDEATGQQQRSDRPEVNYTRRPDKTCIWIEYRQHWLSVLLDTGSDVSIAGENSPESWAGRFAHTVLRRSALPTIRQCQSAEPYAWHWLSQAAA